MKTRRCGSCGTAAGLSWKPRLECWICAACLRAMSTEYPPAKVPVDPPSLTASLAIVADSVRLIAARLSRQEDAVVVADAIDRLEAAIDYLHHRRLRKGAR